MCVYFMAIGVVCNLLDLESIEIFVLDGSWFFTCRFREQLFVVNMYIRGPL